MLNSNPKSKLRTMDNVKIEIFEDIKQSFKEKFGKDIDDEDIFIVAETQTTAIETALEQGDNIRCMYLGTFKVQPNLVQLAELRREFIQAGFNPQDAHKKAKDQMDVVMMAKYNEAVEENKFGKKDKQVKLNKENKLRNSRVNKVINLPLKRK
jgi:hypothetical protein